MKSKKLSLYAGISHKGKKPFIATTSNGANIAGKTSLIVNFNKRSTSELLYDLARFEFFVKRLRETIDSRRFNQKRFTKEFNKIVKS